MEKGIKLQLSQPDKTVIAGEYPAVILPAQVSNLTVIPGRAPSLVLLAPGMLQLLDNTSKVIAIYFLKNGVASVADDVCRVSSEHIIAKKDIALETAAAELEKAASTEDKAFYQAIVDELTAFPL